MGLEAGRRILLFSGGVDSAYLLSVSHISGDGPEALTPLFVSYGQPSATAEWGAAKAITKKLGSPLFRVVVDGVPLGDMDIGEGARVVPARNLWLISLAASLLPVALPPIPQVGFSRNQIWIGAAPQDHADYPDCREAFLESMRKPLLFLGHDLRWSKVTREERVAHLDEHGLLGLTHSCYDEVTCGECPSCLQ